LAAEAVQGGRDEGIAGHGQPNQGAQEAQHDNVKQQKHQLLRGAFRVLERRACMWVM